MIEPGLGDKVVLVTGANNPYRKDIAAVIVFLASEQASWLKG
jgi:hypothetical protein